MVYFKEWKSLSLKTTQMQNLFFKSLLATICAVFVKYSFVNALPYSNLEQRDLQESLLFELGIITGSSNCTIFLAISSSAKLKLRQREIPLLEYLESGQALNNKVILLFDKDVFLGEKNLNSRYPFRFSRACSLVEHYDFEYPNIPTNFRKIIPGGFFQSYHLFLVPPHPEFNPNLSISAGLELLHFAVLDLDKISHSSSSVSQLFQSNGKPNWNKRPIIAALEFGAGNQHVQYFKDKGQWNNYMVARLYYSALYMNATLEFNSLDGIPSQGQTKSGSWGSFVEPLINGSNHVCTAIIPSYYPADLIFFTRSALFSEYIFITALPRERSLTPFEALINPFSESIWIGILLSMIGMFFLLQGSIISSLIQGSSKFDFVLYKRRSAEAFLGVLNPIFEQPGLGRGLNKLFYNADSWRFYVLWTIAAMLLSNFYKGNVISGFVKPFFTFAPRNFEELINSNFKVNGILYDENLKKDLRRVNTTLAQVLLSRTQDTGWPHGMPLCFLSILKWDNVCIGVRIILGSTGLMFLTNPERQPLFRQSDDGIMPIAASFGVSRHYPEVVCSVNKIISLLEPSGLHLHWAEVDKRDLISMGRHMSPKIEDSGISVNWKISSFLLEISLAGYVVSLILFLTELLSTWAHKFKQRTIVTEIVF